MNKTVTAFSIITVLTLSQSSAQTAFTTKEYVDMGNIKTAVLLHGDMNWDLVTQSPECEFPKGSGIHLAHATTLWMGGYDQQNQLHVSAQTYRQTGNDFWPGPLDSNGNLDIATSTKWARIWKVNFIEIGKHINNTNRTGNNTPADILHWPAKGNPYARGNNGAPLVINTDMAPFVDVNSDGIYDPLSGDYPDIKGDQMLWWVFSDNGPTHDNTISQPLHVEVHAKAYAYARGTLIDNVVFYEMDIHNKSYWDYSGFRMAVNADMDLGYNNDDYIGFDSARRLGYVYNGITIDGGGTNPGYDSTPPIAGYAFLKMPGDNGSNVVPAGSFMTFRNDASVAGNPQNATEFYYYMTSRFRDGIHLNNDFAGTHINSTGRGPGPQADYMFTGNHADTNSWSECNCNNPVGDRRFVLSTGDITINQNTNASITFALVTTNRGLNHTCPGLSIANVLEVADTAWKYYLNPPASRLSVQDVAGNKAIRLYPNPAGNMLNINSTNDPLPADINLSVYDITGKKINIGYTTKGDEIKADVSALPPGVYNIRLSSKTINTAAVFVKE